MAIPDLLWACPECREDRGLVSNKEGARCRACGTRFVRGEGAEIRGRLPDGTDVVRSPEAWLDMLPDPETLVAQEDTGDTPIRTARVLISRVTGSETVYGETGYLNRVEIWGEESPGTVRLLPDALGFEYDGGNRAESWPLEAVTAVQASSSTLQLNRRDAPLVSFRFLDDSVLLWEELLHAALSAFYARTGRGKIVEYQPRIATE